MAVSGWLPVDTIISYAGLVWMGHILATLQRHRLYLVLIAAGVVWLLANALRGRGGLLDVAVYLALALALLEVFGARGVGIAPQPSVAERSGARLDPTAPSPPQDTVVIPRGFGTVTGALQGTVDALLPVINADFARNPFALLAAMNSLMLGGFDEDPALRARLGEFLDQCYGPALLRWAQANPTAPPEAALEVDTPLSGALEALYGQLPFTLSSPTPGGEATVPCSTVWEPLKRDLFTYADRQGSSTWMGWVRTRVSQWSSLSADAWLRNALRRFRTSHQFAAGFNAAEVRGGLSEPGFALVSGLLAPLTYAVNWAVAAQLVEMVRYAASPVLGYVTAILYVAFPFVLATALLPGGAGRLLTYFALLGSVKAWPLVWAMVDQIYVRVLPSFAGVATTPGGTLDFYKPPIALNVVTGLMYLLGPAMLSTALGIAGLALGRWLSQFTTARLPLFLLRR